MPKVEVISRHHFAREYQMEAKYFQIRQTDDRAIRRKRKRKSLAHLIADGLELATV